MKQVSLYDKKSAPKVSTKYRILFFCDSNQNYIASVFIGRTDAEAEAPILWPPDAKSKLTGKKKKKQCWERLRTGGEGDNRGWHH